MHSDKLCVCFLKKIAKCVLKRFHEANTVVVPRKRAQHCSAMLRQSQNNRNVGNCCAKSLTGFKLYAASVNIIVVPYKRTQHVWANNVACCWPTILRVVAQQCCLFLANNVVCCCSTMLRVVAQQCCELLLNNVACCWSTMLHVVGQQCCVLLVYNVACCWSTMLRGSGQQCCVLLVNNVACCWSTMLRVVSIQCCVLLVNNVAWCWSTMLRVVGQQCCVLLVNNVACCWSTMFSPFDWLFKAVLQRVNSMHQRFSAQHRIVENRSPCNMPPGTIFCATLDSATCCEFFN